MNNDRCRAIWSRMVTVMTGCGIILLTALFFYPVKIYAEEFDIPIGPAYQGRKCMTTVEKFSVEVCGAPLEIGNGLQEMLQTALFDSNYFVLVDRLDPQGISAEQLLSDSFMADPDAILAMGQMDPAEVLIYGSLTALEGGGAGLRVKAPWIPLTVGGTYHGARAEIDVRAVDAASGRIIATAHRSGHATSGKGNVGSTIHGMDMPVALEMFKNTPLELCIRDSIYRCVVDLCKTIPSDYFRH